MNLDLLKHPNIPKPLHGVNPRTIYGDEWWETARHEAYKFNNYCCHACDVPKKEAKYHHWLEAHEHYDINYRTGEVTFVGVVALCHACHNYIHDGRMLILASKGKLSWPKYHDIIQHGNDLLGFELKQPLKPYTPALDAGIEIAPWDKWHLNLDGTKHYSPYKNIKEWAKHYAETRED